MSESEEQPGNHNNLATILGSILKRVLKVEIPCAINIPEEFIGVHDNFDCIPLFTLENVLFYRIPADILDPIKNDTTPYENLLKKIGITKQEDIDDLIVALRDNMEFNHRYGQVTPFYPLSWISEEVASSIQFMKTPFDRFGKKCFIYSLATMIPVSENYRIRNVFFTQMILILLKRVERDDNTKLEYSYYISNKLKLNLFIAVIG